ncbi:integrator complex subunit 15 isoform X2 [Ursus arctos]|uniref:integrator complex subunit 15 isoform X2 n=1 Tax=Ursus arctos TaxID=9644 RepID=UPI00201783DF|nr:integrator complex subunit 15 isoform X2 [Ursus arctos]
MSDIRHSLLRRDALSAAKEVLYHLDIYFSSQLQSAPLPIVDKGPVELLEEFVFQRLNSLQELQLLEIMCNYFQEQTKDSVRQIIFSSLFSPQGNKADDSRMSLLGKLVSMAVAVCRIPVLECAASWLQRTPVVYCVRLARALVDDYCCLVPGSVQTLKQTLSASPRFCCQLVTSVTALYDLSSDDLIPPLDLLEMIVGWIFEDPRLILITFLNTPIAANLPIGFLELTPLTGLIRWCVKAPLAYKRKKKPSLSNGHVTTKVTKDSGGMDRDSHLLYSKLHLSVLQVLMVLQVHLTEKNLYGRLGLILFDHMVPLVEEVSRLADELNPLNASQEIELSLDRLAQALQVAMASGALLCTRDDLRTLCSRLPHNNKGVKTIQQEKNSLFNKWCQDKWISACRRMNLDPYLTPYINITSKWSEDLNVCIGAHLQHSARHAQGEHLLSDDEDRDRDDASASQETPQTDGSTRSWERDKEQTLPHSLRRNQPLQHPDQHLWNCPTLISMVSTLCVVRCHGNPRKLEQSPSGAPFW